MKHSRPKAKTILTGMAGVILLTCLDQFTKYLAVKFLKGQPAIELLPGVFELSYLENKGAAWGMLENMQWLFLIFTLVILIVVGYAYLRPPFDRTGTFRVLAAVLVSGAVGNAIDRLMQGYVVDFFYISLIDFPVFNVADCYVTFSLVLFLVIYRKEVIEWIRSE